MRIFEDVAIPDPVGTGKVLDRNGLVEGLTQLEKHGLAPVRGAALWGMGHAWGVAHARDVVSRHTTWSVACLV